MFIRNFKLPSKKELELSYKLNILHTQHYKYRNIKRQWKVCSLYEHTPPPKKKKITQWKLCLVKFREPTILDLVMWLGGDSVHLI
jgi:hypothetical protein